jgi:hypothetical protein
MEALMQLFYLSQIVYHSSGWKKDSWFARFDLAQAEI